jgi:AraC-like DNA-binding protein
LKPPIAPQLEAELKQQLADSPLKEQVKGNSQETPGGQKPRLEDVAVELRVSARTLQRRLLEEGITFHNLVKEARRDTKTLTPSFEHFTSGRGLLPASGDRLIAQVLHAGFD